MKRNCNKVADALAKKSWVGLELECQVWVEDLPGDIIPLALFDVHLFSYVSIKALVCLTNWFLKNKKKKIFTLLSLRCET